METHDVPELKHGVITLCGKGACGCPRVNFNNTKFVVIRDDFGGKVKIPHENWKLLESYIISKNITKSI